MKTILVLTDFSKLSRVAVSYAIGMARKMEAKIILLSVINASSSSNTLMNWKKLEEEMVKGAKEDADKLMDDMKKEIGTVKVSFRAVLGFPIEVIVNQFARKNKVDFIVMGTKGASGLKKVMIGSNAASVIDSSSVPVLVVPGNAAFKTIKKIVYATDLKNLPTEIRTMARFATFFNAPIHVLHVVKDSSQTEMEELERNMARISKEEQLIATAKYPKIHFHVLKSANTATALDKFVQDNKADLLAMFTHRLDFYEKLFGKSVTRQLAFHSKVPMLAFNKTNMGQ